MAPNASLEAGRRKAHPQGHRLRVRGLRRRPRERLAAVDGVAHHAADLSRGAGARQGSADFDAYHPTVDFDACHSIDSTPFRSRVAFHKVNVPSRTAAEAGGTRGPRASRRACPTRRRWRGSGTWSPRLGLCRVVVVQRLRAVFLRLMISPCLIVVWRVAWRDRRAYTISYKTEENCPHRRAARGRRACSSAPASPARAC